MADAPSAPRPTISTHVLDAAAGRPAAGVRVTLSRVGADGAATRVTEARTDDDGRVRDLLGGPLEPGDYRLEFDLADRDGDVFRRMAIDLRVDDVARGYHVPLLLSPYAMTTYRGS